MTHKILGAIGILAAGFAGFTAAGAFLAYAGLGTGMVPRVAAAVIALGVFYAAGTFLGVLPRRAGARDGG